MTRLLFALLLMLLISPVAAQPDDDGCRELFELLHGKNLDFVEWDSEGYGWPSLADDTFDEYAAVCYTEGGSWIEVQRSRATGRMIVFLFASSAQWTDANGEHDGIHDFYGPFEIVENK